MAKKNIGRRQTAPKGKRRGGSSGFKNYLLLGAGVVLIGLAAWLIFGSGSGKDHGDLTIVENLPVEPSADNVRMELHLDNSTSMAGFTSNGTNGYYAALNKMRFAYEVNPTLYVGDSIYKGKDIITYLQNNKETMKGASRIDQDLDALFKKAGKNKNGLYIYLTDGIMSGSDKEINLTQAKDFNLTHKEELSNRIKRAAGANADAGVSVYQFSSDFNGDYYAYNNDHKPIRGHHAFYAIVIANPAILADFKNKMNAGGKDVITPENQWHYIDKLPLNWQPKVEAGNVKKGVTEKQRNLGNPNTTADKKDDVANSGKDSTSQAKKAGIPLYVINSKINLKNIPDKAVTGASKNIKGKNKPDNNASSRQEKGICFRLKTANFKNQTVDFNQLADSLDVRINGTKSKPKYGPVYNSSAEAIEFWYSFSDLRNGAEMYLSIPQIYPAWVEDYNTDNDLYILSNSGNPFFMGVEPEKTFLLKYLVNGLRNGKVKADTPLFETTFRIEFE